MPGIAAAPSPVVPSPKSSNGNNSATDTQNAADTATANPFSSVLQRFVKSKAPEGKEAASSSGDAKQALLLENTASTGAEQDIMASMMAMLQGQQNLKGKDDSSALDSSKSQDKTTKGDEAQTGPSDNALAALALNQPVVATDEKAKSDQDSLPSGGKQGLSLADKTAILATDEAATAAVSKSGKDGEESFQSLLEGTHGIQLQNQNQTQAVPIASQIARQENRIETPVGHQNWSQEVGDKLTWMVGKQESKAELVLNPPQMGRIEVSITLNGDQANASFTSANPAVREALESALPRLKEILADAGVRLDQAQVGTDARGDSTQNQERRDNSGHNSKVVTGEFVPGLAPLTSTTNSWISKGNGMVDTFA